MQNRSHSVSRSHIQSPVCSLWRHMNTHLICMHIMWNVFFYTFYYFACSLSYIYDLFKQRKTEVWAVRAQEQEIKIYISDFWGVWDCNRTIFWRRLYILTPDSHKRSVPGRWIAIYFKKCWYFTRCMFLLFNNVDRI